MATNNVIKRRQQENGYWGLGKGCTRQIAQEVLSASWTGNRYDKMFSESVKATPRKLARAAARAVTQVCEL